ncbi:MAG: MBL fold metallo-hydrolase [Epulopiscium sp.]|jgi:hydroxyacylglutathione hydrolase|nr:MBL fold metallo-hydrolase [Candidatus Epulonipiscium sp.]
MKIKGLEMGSIGTNCYVVSDDNNICAIIDCDGNPKPLFDYVEANQLTPTHILLTHGHFDHIGAVEVVKEKYGCHVIACEKEREVLENPSVNVSSFSGFPISLLADSYCKEGDIITVGDLNFTVMETPGHTVGSVCFVIEDAIFSGDTLFLGSCGRTDFPTGDWNTILQSLQRLKNLEKDYVVYPGHGPATTLANERVSNPYM